MTDRKEYLRNWRIANREKLREYGRARYRAKRSEWFTPEAIAARAAYAKAHPEQAVKQIQRSNKRHPEHFKARYTLTNALRAGKLVKPDACSKCGKVGRIHGHHLDYAKPLDVIWLCRPCHVEEHAR